MLKKINLIEILNTVIILLGVILLTVDGFCGESGTFLEYGIFAFVSVLTFYAVGVKNKKMLLAKIIWYLVYVFLLVLVVINTFEGSDIGFVITSILFYYVSFRVIVTLEQKETSVSYNTLILISYVLIYTIVLSDIPSLTFTIYILFANLLLSTYAKETKPKKIKNK